jgi:DNA uptake protein ComE-like DNA-binding protein
MNNENVPRVLKWWDERNRVVGEYSVRIEDESGKININTAVSENLRRLLDAFKEAESAALADGIIRYREEIKPNKAFDTIHELLLLDGIKRETFLGEDSNEDGYADKREEKGFVPELDYYDRTLEPGLKSYVTVFTDGKINLNTASADVLMSMPGVDEKTADALIKQRKQKPFVLLANVKEMPAIAQATFEEIVRWASVRSDWYKIIIHARAQNSDRHKIIVAYVDRTGERSKIKYWREN